MWWLLLCYSWDWPLCGRNRQNVIVSLLCFSNKNSPQPPPLVVTPATRRKQFCHFKKGNRESHRQCGKKPLFTYIIKNVSSFTIKFKSHFNLKFTAWRFVGKLEICGKLVEKCSNSTQFSLIDIGLLARGALQLYSVPIMHYQVVETACCNCQRCCHCHSV